MIRAFRVVASIVLPATTALALLGAAWTGSALASPIEPAHTTSHNSYPPRLAVVDARIGSRPMDPTVRGAFEEFRAHHLVFDRRLTAAEREASLAPELIDTILRVEGVFDPTRIGAFGPSLRMRVRPGTASMTDVFGERWRRADGDPNLHYRVKYLAQAWLAPPASTCDDFWRFRAGDLASVLDLPTPSDCQRLLDKQRDRSVDREGAVISPAPTGVPIFAAPYPGSRFSPAELKKINDARLGAIRTLAWLNQRGQL